MKRNGHSRPPVQAPSGFAGSRAWLAILIGLETAFDELQLAI